MCGALVAAGGWKGSHRELVCVGVDAVPLAEQWLAMCSRAACVPRAQKHIQAGNYQATHTDTLHWSQHTHTQSGREHALLPHLKPDSHILLLLE